MTLPSSRAELRAQGKAARTQTPRRLLAAVGGGERDPLGILARQHESRDPELVPLRTERMAQSPFAFFRGTAALMAADLATSPHSGILVGSSGDAHVANFGFYASPQRRLVFDLNDFDEAAWAPWEWDVKRLVTSLIVGGTASGRSSGTLEEAARAAVGTYLKALREDTKLSPTQRYFLHFDIESSRAALKGPGRRAVEDAVHQAQKRTGERAVRRLTERDPDGRRRIVLRPPTTTAVTPEVGGMVESLLTSYRATLPHDLNLLLEHYVPVDIARRVVGVGSVGTRCYLGLLQDGNDNALLLQPKQASPSVLVEYGRVEQPPALRDLVATSGEGARVVALQRILQALSDPFLGYVRSVEHDYYLRQFHDMKGGIDVTELDDPGFVTYGRACAAVLARAHSQSRPAPQIIGYAGGGRAITEAIVAWSHAYADRSRADYDAFVAASA